ncbi:hypothetical protein Catovirus_1_575 [Catovirus CTV1]|uniref:Uncharacterized protein n=1 Tax=Catovirus CTV1 TaxID=1977631 RepID=A0A1V0S9Y3_9VIRU|nr:hypothetical protein Catovirus_1_575 [Catovirus CTV1]
MENHALTSLPWKISTEFLLFGILSQKWDLPIGTAQQNRIR